MKRKSSMLRFIVLRFIAYSLGTELAISVLEEILNTSREPVQLILWGLAQLLVYSAGVLLFAHSIHRKLQEQIRENEKERSQLFSNIAHDLKTPMTTISGYAGALADGVVEDADKQREYHLAIKAKSVQMNRLINQLLTYSKLGTARYQLSLSREDAAELLRAACAECFGEIEEKRMELDLHLPDTPVFCMVDSLELRRAVGNLLTNAIRHNPAGTLLLVSLTEEPGRITIQIADSGAAIPEAANLFEPFVTGSDSRSGGTGLGLAIVKKEAEQHGGEITLSPAPAPYTKMFMLHLPIK